VTGFDARQLGQAVRFSVYVQPRSSRNEVVGIHGSGLKIRMTAPPVEGLANEALIDFLSRELEIPRRNVCIVSGFASRTKVVEISEVDLETIQRLAG
jgi:uncharacterized protein (TIGR00251 family)